MVPTRLVNNKMGKWIQCLGNKGKPVMGWWPAYSEWIVNGGCTACRANKGGHRAVSFQSLLDSFNSNQPCHKCTCVGGAPACYIHLATAGRLWIEKFWKSRWLVPLAETHLHEKANQWLKTVCRLLIWQQWKITRCIEKHEYSVILS